ncbi:MAG: hypothetical protein GY928_16660 [Colwellia sp.]|nr:hypothetical protein [Colwellia sp.]
MTWFENLTGFRETSSNQVRQNITVDGDKLISQVNGKVMACGRLEIPSLGELRERVNIDRQGSGKISVREVVADTRALHTNETNSESLFQVASQFNLLEMVSPMITPDQGVGIYENDPTQGPACAIAAGAGTIYRNYFAPVDGQIGQSKDKQIDCLEDMSLELGNKNSRLWQIQNGYALASRSGLIEITNRLRSSSEDELDEIRKLLRIGIQWNTQVTLENLSHKVSQAYCSALPVAYCNQPSDLWEDFARLILEASYEATICAAILNFRNTDNNTIFLTMLGGGAFGNETIWITDGIKRALKLYDDWNIDVAIVSYGTSKGYIRQLVEEFS